MMKNVIKLEIVENFCREAENATEALITLREDIYNMDFSILKKNCDDADFRMMFLQTAAEYIYRTCPSCREMFTIFNLEEVIAETIDYGQYITFIGHKFMDDVCAKIVWRMLND